MSNIKIEILNEIIRFEQGGNEARSIKLSPAAVNKILSLPSEVIGSPLASEFSRQGRQALVWRSFLGLTVTMDRGLQQDFEISQEEVRTPGVPSQVVRGRSSQR